MSEGVLSSDAIPNTLVRHPGPGSAVTTARALRCGSIACRRPIAPDLVNLRAGAHELTDILDAMDKATPSAMKGPCDEAAERYQIVWK